MRPLLLVFLALGWHFLCYGAPGAPGADHAAPLAGPARTEAQVRRQLLDVASSQVDVREDLVQGKYRNSGPEVRQYLRAVGLPEGYAWCSAFVVWCCKTIGLLVNADGAARSWFNARTIIWPHVAGAGPPQPGDLVGYQFSHAWIDHVGILVIWGQTPLAETIEGNTGSRHATREGEGVHRKWVLKSQIHRVADLFKCLKRQP